MNTERLVIVDGVRTPFCKMGTELAGLGADGLGRIAVSALLTRTDSDPALIDDVIFGCVAQPADAMNVARVIALRAGIPQSVPAVTVHRNCASGFEALTQAQEKMLAGRGKIFVVGGAESMSNIPLLFNASAAKKFGQLARAKSFLQRAKVFATFRPADFKPRIGLMLGLTDPVCNLALPIRVFPHLRNPNGSAEKTLRFRPRETAVSEPDRAGALPVLFLRQRRCVLRGRDRGTDRAA